jgi:hypothetical protein
MVVSTGVVIVTAVQEHKSALVRFVLAQNSCPDMAIEKRRGACCILLYFFNNVQGREM